MADTFQFRWTNDDIEEGMAAKFKKVCDKRDASMSRVARDLVVAWIKDCEKEDDAKKRDGLGAK
jgi:hypothetical protein